MDPKMGELIGGSDEVTRAEVVHAVREECAIHLPDVVIRRTDLGTLGNPGPVALKACADIVGEELGWDTATRAEEIQAAEDCYKFVD